MSSAQQTASGEASPDPRPRGTTLGRYLLLDRLGAGGMGVVYAAYDPELDRKVAVKILHADRASHDRQRRLTREAQAMARLSHPNVVAVHDVGLADGAVFVAMEHVDGDNLSVWRATPRTWREVVHVFVAAGQGLAAAHRAGLVHRDFKPDNVLLRAADQRVLVSDFGLARLADDTPEPSEPSEPHAAVSSLAQSLTHAGALLGTPAYMAPEQHRGDPADARSDQFAFCVALYEALYAERPFGAIADGGLDTLDALALEVVKGNVRPAPRDSAVPSWLRKLVLRGLRPAPDDRWPSMDALLAALRRDPARALRGWLIGGGALAAMIAAVVVMRGGSHAEPSCNGGEARVAAVWGPQVKTAAAAAFAATGTPSAGDTWQRVERGLDDYASRWSAMHADTCRATEIRHEQSSELEDLRMACLDRKLATFGALASLFTANVDAGLLGRAASAADALPPIDTCADVTALRALVPLPDDPRVRQQITDLELRVAKLAALDAAGKDEDSRPLVEPLLAEARAVGYPVLIADVLYQRMGMYEGLRDFKGAETAANEALAAAADAHQDEHMAHIVSSLEGALRSQGRVTGALLLVPMADAFLHRAGNPARTRVEVDHIRAQLLQAAGKLADAETLARTVVALEDHLGYHKGTYGAVTFTLATILIDEGKYDDAKPYLATSLATYLAVFGPDNIDVAAVYNSRAVIETQGDQDLAAAEHDLQEAIRIGTAAAGPDSDMVCVAGGNLGAVETEQGKSAAAIAAYERAIECRTKVSGADNPEVANNYNNLAAQANEDGRYAQGLDDAQRAVAIDEKTRGPTHPVLASHLDTVAKLLLALARPADAKPLLERAIAIDLKGLPADHSQLVVARLDDAECLLELGHPADAIPLIDQALAVLDIKYPDDHLGAVARFERGQAMWALGGDRKAARGKVVEARAIFEKIDMSASDKRLHAKVIAWLAAHPG